MRGHEPLLALRRQGYRPAIVWLDVGTDKLRCWRDWAVESPDHAHIEVSERDDPATIDLRFVVGMTVIVTQLPPASSDLAMAFADAAHRHNAGRVIVELE